MVASIMAMLLALSIVAAGAYLWFSTNYSDLEERLQSRVANGVLEAWVRYASALDTAADDVLTYAALVPPALLLEGGERDGLARFERIGLRMLSYKEQYDQVRLIDENGLEVVRVERANRGEPIRTEGLADKSNRYYVQRGLTLGEGQIYVSGTDLNVEAGEIERPLKPVFRVVAPIVADGETVGIAVVNVLAEPLLDQLVSSVAARTTFNPEIFVVDESGNFIYAPDPTLRWSHILAPSPEEVVTMGEIYPALWRRIRGTNPPDQAADGVLSHRGLDTSTLLPERGVEGPQQLLLIAHVPSRQIGEVLLDRSPWTFAVMALLFILILLSLYLIARLRRTRLRRIYELREAAFTDALTGYLNRRSLELVLHRQLASVARNKTRVAFALLDIDHFKSINDTYGHSAGDMVLREIARRVRDELRETDYAARWGGEEFALLLVGAGEREGKEKTDELRKRVEAEPIEVAGEQVTVTVSGGVVACEPKLGEAALFDAADTYLYLAKQHGRNRIVGIEEAEELGHSP